MAYKRAKNLLSSRDTYNCYYGDFRGVDFSSDHTQVIEQRLAYAVNMYKDYQSGQGKALETVPGFRRRVVLPGGAEIFGIHNFKHKDENDTITTKILIHSGNKLYLWYNYPRSIGVIKKESIALPEGELREDGLLTFELKLVDGVEEITEIHSIDGEIIRANWGYNKATQTLTIKQNDLYKNDTITYSYYEGVLSTENAIFSEMNTGKSVSFIMNNRLYLIDGKNYIYYDGESVHRVDEGAYIPTTHINIIPSGENADAGAEYEQYNILQPKFKNTFSAAAGDSVFILSQNECDSIEDVSVNGKTCTFTADITAGKVTLSAALKEKAEVVITASKKISMFSGVDGADIIRKCTLACVYDNRVFLSGNPSYPNHIFWCMLNSTGHPDPSYFGILNYQQDGVGNSAITGMIPIADSLMVLKNDTQQDGSVYYHVPEITGDGVYTKKYPSTRGLNGIGCLGACVNFLDDPVFISRLGVEAVGQLSIRYERAIEHRSSLIDAKLVNLGEMNLKNAVFEEWNGYLLLLVDGNIFMADSRQRYTHETGAMQYEWYYLEDIGVFEGAWDEYLYESNFSEVLKNQKSPEGYAFAIHETPLESVNADSNVDANGDELVKIYTLSVESGDTGENGEAQYYVYEFFYTPDAEEEKAYLCRKPGNTVGGEFKKAVILKAIEGNVFFGTENGIVCSFNFDKRDEYGEIPIEYYSFDGRTIFSGVATKMDCCGIPHLTKSTVKKSTVIKTKAMLSSAIKLKVRTNKTPYRQIARINTNKLNFNDIDFDDFSFITEDESIFSVKEKEKQWAEKQYLIYSDEFRKPFSLVYIAFRYTIAGKIKN